MSGAVDSWAEFWDADCCPIDVEVATECVPWEAGGKPVYPGIGCCPACEPAIGKTGIVGGGMPCVVPGVACWLANAWGRRLLESVRIRCACVDKLLSLVRKGASRPWGREFC